MSEDVDVVAGGMGSEEEEEEDGAGGVGVQRRRRSECPEKKKKKWGWASGLMRWIWSGSVYGVAVSLKWKLIPTLKLSV